MICREIIEVIEKDFPRECALEWDNVGLLAGRDDKEVKCIYIALDATDEAVGMAAAAEADMLVTHHPLIFGGLKRVSNQDFTGRRLLTLIRQDISYYAMHTNYDVCRMGRLAGERLCFEGSEILEVTGEKEGPVGIGEIAYLPREMSLGECAEAVKAAFGLLHVKIYGDLGRTVFRAAVCPGSGKSVIKEAVRKGADVLITGDIGHHDGIDAVAQGMAVIDAGHYGVEHIFIGDMKKYFDGRLSGVKVIEAPVSHPFQVI